MTTLTANSAFHHVEVPCDDLETAEQFYGKVFGAKVYMRKDAERRTGVPAEGTISRAESRGFSIDATYMKIGESFRIGFLKRTQDHRQAEIDHFAFVIDDDLEALEAALVNEDVEIVDRDPNRMLIRDPFGLVLELWPRETLERMGLL